MCTPCPLRNTILMCRANTFPILGRRVTNCPASSRDGRADCVPCISPRARVIPHAALHHPPVHPGYHPGPAQPPLARRLQRRSAPLHARSACIMRPALVPRPHGSSRRCTVFCTAQSGVCRLGPLQTPLLPCGFCRIPRSQVQVCPTLRSVGWPACPDDRRQKPQPQLLLLLTAR